MKKLTAVLLTLAVMLVGSSALLAADGAAVYKAKCASCHGADGSKTEFAKQPMRALGSPEVQKQSDKELYDWTAKGKGKMPGYEKKLSADEINALVKFMRGLKK